MPDGTFTTDSSGNIPSGVTDTVPTNAFGGVWMIVCNTANCNTGTPVSAIAFTTTGCVTESSNSQKINRGEDFKITVTVNCATGDTFAYQWYSSTDSSCSSLTSLGSSYQTSTFDYTPSATGTFYFCLITTDTVTSATVTTEVTVTVYPTLVAPTISASPTNINQGQSSTLTTTSSFNGGGPPYTCQWLEEAPGGSSYSSLGSSFTCNAGDTPSISTGALTSPTGVWHFELLVVDGSTSPTPEGISSAVTVTVNAIALSAGTIFPSSPVIDSGQSISLMASPSGGTGPYTYQWYTGASCTSPISGATSSTYSASSAGTYYVQVTDSLLATACSAGDAVTVDAAPSAGPITPSSPTIDNGQSILLTAPAPTGGTGTFTYQWYVASSPGTCNTGDTLISGATLSTYTITTPTAYDPYYACYIITDTGVTSGSSPTPTSGSATDLVTVSAALTAPAISPGSSAFDAGGATSLSAASSFSGGTGPYTCQWLSEAPGASSYSNMGASFSCSVGSIASATTGVLLSPTGVYHYELTVTDSAATPVSMTSAAIAVTLNSSPSGVSLGSFASNPVGLGTSDSVSVIWSGGTGPFTVTLYYSTSSTSCSSSNTEAAQVTGVSSSPESMAFTTPGSANTYYYCAVVADADSNSAASSTSGSSLTVFAALSAGTITPSPATIDQGQSILLTANPTGGNPGYTYQWYSGTGCSGSVLSTAQTYSPSPASTTTYYVLVTDSLGATSCSSGATVTVDPSLAAGSITPSSSTIDNGQSVLLSASWSGGAGTYTVTWYSGSSATCASDTTVEATHSSVASSPDTLLVSPTSSKYYCAVVTDMASGTPSQSATDAAIQVVVNLALTAPSAPTPSPTAIDVNQGITVTDTIPSTGTSTYGWEFLIKVNSGSYVPATQCTLTWSGVGALAGDIETCTIPAGALTAADTYSFEFVVNDSAHTSEVQTSPPSSTVSVGTALTAPAAPVPSATSLDVNQGLTVTATIPSTGTATYGWQWLVSVDGGLYSSGSAVVCAVNGGSGATAGTTETCSISPNSLLVGDTYNFEIQVTDSASTPESATSPTSSTVTVNASPSSVTLGSFASNPVSTSTSESVQVSWTGGTGPFTVTLYQETSSTSCAITTQAGQQTGVASSPYTMTFTSPSSTGTYYYCAQVTDTFSNSANSPSPEPSLIVANVPSSVTLGSFSISPVDISTSDTVSVSWSGGASPFTVTLYYSSSAGTCLSSGTTAAAASSVVSSPHAMTFTAPASPGTYYFCATVTDSGSNSGSSSTFALTVGAALTAGSPTPGLASIDTGQSIAISANPTGGSGGNTIQWFSGASSTCSSDVTSAGTGTSISPSPTANSYYCYTVTDSSGNSATSTTAHILVYAPQFTGTTIAITPSATIDSGQSVTLTVSWAANGVAPYTIQLQTSSSTSCTSPSNVGSAHVTSGLSTTFSVSTGGIYCATVTDGAYSPESSSTTTGVTIAVSAALAAPSISASPSTIDQGQSSTLSTSASFTGGTSPYTCQWLQEAPGAGSFSSLGSSFACSSGSTPTTSTGGLDIDGVWSFELQVTDSAYNQVTVASSAVTVTVNPGLSLPPISPSPSTIDSGQSSTISATAAITGGTSPYTCQWEIEAPGASQFSNLGASFACTTGDMPTVSTGALSAPGTWNFQLYVIDSVHGAAGSSFTSLTVNPSLAAPIITASPTTTDQQLFGELGSTLSSSAVTTGTSPLQFQWFEEAPGGSYVKVGINSSTYLFYPGRTTPTGAWSFVLEVTDSAGTSVNSTATTVLVNPVFLPSWAFSPDPATLDVGQSFSQTVTISGGTSPYSFAWSLPAGSIVISGCTSTSNTCSISENSQGTYTAGVTVTDAAGSSNAWGESFTVNSALSPASIAASHGTLDSGQSGTLFVTSGFSGGTSTYTCQWLQEAPGGGSYNSLGSTFSCSTGSTSYTSSTGTLSTTGTWSFELQVTDSAGVHETVTSGSVTVTVNSAMTQPGAPTTSAPEVDQGQWLNITGTIPSTGTGPYAWQWLISVDGGSYVGMTQCYTGSGNGGSANGGTGGTASEAVKCNIQPGTLTAGHSYSFELEVTDSSGTPESQPSSPTTVPVGSDLVVGSLSPSSATIDSGQATTFTASPSGGTTPYSYVWNLPSGVSVSSGCASTSATCTVTSATPGGYSVSVTVSDGAGESGTTGASSLTVNPLPTAGPVTPSSPIIDSGQPITLTVNPTGGTGPDAYQWYTSSDCTTSPVAGATSSTYSPSPTSTTTYYVLVTDATGATSCSSGAAVTVNSALTAGAITPASPSITKGSSVTLTANPSGGTPSYSYQWYSGSSCTSLIAGATSSTYAASPTSTTTYYYEVTDSASTPESACSAGDKVTVLSPPPALSVSVFASPSSVSPGTGVTFNATVAGGSSPYTFTWSVPSGVTIVSGCTASSSTCTVKSSTPGSYSIGVKVTDSRSATASSSASFTVTSGAPLTTGGIQPPSPKIDGGQPITLTVTPTGGFGPYTYQWFTGAGCTGPITGASSSSLIVSPTSTTTYYVLVTDSAGVTVCAGGNTVTVNGQLVAGPITPSSPKVGASQTVALTANPSGGTTPYTYQWYAGAGCLTAISGATSPALSASPSVNTTYSYMVTDSAFNPESACSPADAVTVSSQPVVTITPTSGPPGTLIFLSGDDFAPSGVYNYCFESGVTTANMTACPSTYQFTSTATGGVPPLTDLTAFGLSGLVVVSDASTGQIVAYAQFTVTSASGGPTLVLNPASGLTGTPVTATGSGFTPGVTVSIIISRGVVATATVGSDGTFTASFRIPSSPPGPETVTATGNDISADPLDVATATFSVTNVGAYQSDVIPITNATGTVTINDTATNGVSITISGINSSLTSIRIELANLTRPSYGVSPANFAGGVWYYDVYVVGTGTIAPGITAHVCITNPNVATQTAMEYWNGSAWVTPGDTTVNGATICGTVPVSGLSGTNFLIANNAPPHKVVTNSWIWLFIVPLLVGSLVTLLGFLFWFFALGKRRRKDEEEENGDAIL